ncbi:MAG: hypothetical protein OEW04_02165 [Nitrospirota bacterium]|nr:hypothetical protein [Nitrospirota bacterium]
MAKNINKDKIEIETLPPQQSGVRRMMADAAGRSYQSFKTLSEAQHHDNTVAVFEGDYGGQIYLVCPILLIKCDETKLQQLLKDIDSYCWNDPDGGNIYYEQKPESGLISGGMGGGIATTDLWIHDELRKLRLKEDIEDVLSDKKEHIRRRP